jgi:sporulation protein YlmC with PRC-barrel domain
VTRHVGLQHLLGRSVCDADGRDLGVLREVKAERRGDALCVTALVIGKKAWLSRIGWTKIERGEEIPWERVASIGSSIVLRRE